MKKIILVICSIFIFSCNNLNKNNKERNISSSSDDGYSNYYDYSGENGNFNFYYDGSTKDFRGILKSNLESEKLYFIADLAKRRKNLFENNLYDTGVDPNSQDCSKIMNPKKPHRTAKGDCYFYQPTGLLENVLNKVKGLFRKNTNTKITDLNNMGSVNQRFGRNSDPNIVNEHFDKNIMNPNPRLISKRLFTRKNKETIKADKLNILAAAWLQTQNHDWFTHGKNHKARDKKPYHIDPVADDKEFEEGFDIPRTQTDKSRLTDPNRYSKSFRNKVTHWWDASHIYGSDAGTINKVRRSYSEVTNKFGNKLAGGKLAIHPSGRLFYDKLNHPITGFSDNWWLGLDLLHTLFIKEHNYIADTLKAKNPRMSDDEIFEKSRLINAALIAKIHTIDWTPAVLDNKLLHISMYGNWFGYTKQLLGKGNTFFEAISPMVPKRFKNGIIDGFTGKGTLNLSNVPFTLTEEFVAVYRMHPLVPENITLKEFASDKKSKVVPIKDVVFRKTKPQLDKESVNDWLYSFGTSHPGGMVLHNFPSFMQNIRAERNTGNKFSDDAVFDLAAVDVIRDRERGVPKYNDFRRSLGLPHASDFDELTDSKSDAQILKEIYGEDGIEKLDLLVGTLAENDRYEGYAFGNTPFYIFVLMASRRLMADPFYSDYFTEKYYTEFGFKHVQTQNMVDIIIRHFPGLRNAFENEKGERVVKNAFRPWLPIYDSVNLKYKKAVR